MEKKNIFLEEAVLDDISKGLDVVERPISLNIFLIFTILIFFTLLFFLANVFFLDVYNYNVYASRSLMNVNELYSIDAPRGCIYDNSGEYLANNLPTFKAEINLFEILKNPKKIDNYIKDIGNIININEEDIIKKIKNANLEKESYILLSDRLTLQQISDLNKLKFNWLVIKESFLRVYPKGKIFSHIIGYTGFINKKNLNKDLQKEGITLNDKVGKVGLEKYYDSFLRGKKGLFRIFKDSLGNIIDKKQESMPISGNNLYTNIDSGLQEEIYKDMLLQLKKLGRSKGSAIAINPMNGKILSLLSFPVYDNNNLKKKLFIDKKNPLLNRAISGIYSPGSSIKPIVGAGVLNEGIASTSTSIFSAGYIDIPNPYDPAHPSRFLDWRKQGWVNIYSAIAKSSNVYFYEVGGGYKNQKGLGINGLIKYWKMFELDKKTNIDLIGESVGRLPSPEWKEKFIGDIWRIGDTYNASIGQGYLSITPIELVRAISAIANGGFLPRPFIVNEIKDYKGRVIFKNKPELKKIDIPKNILKEIEKGMLDTVRKSYGTAYMLHNIPMKIAAKTGSAQYADNTKTNAFFIGYAPVPNPKILLLILVENAKEGSLNAVPVAKNIFKWYYENRLKVKK